jgi:hypothetical protein
MTDAADVLPWWTIILLGTVAMWAVLSGWARVQLAEFTAGQFVSRWEHHDPAGRVAALQALRDPRVLRQIALSARSKPIGIEARTLFLANYQKERFGPLEQMLARRLEIEHQIDALSASVAGSGGMEVQPEPHKPGDHAVQEIAELQDELTKLGLPAGWPDVLARTGVGIALVGAPYRGASGGFSEHMAADGQRLSMQVMSPTPFIRTTRPALLPALVVSLVFCVVTFYAAVRTASRSGTL